MSFLANADQLVVKLAVLGAPSPAGLGTPTAPLKPPGGPLDLKVPGMNPLGRLDQFRQPGFPGMPNAPAAIPPAPKLPPGPKIPGTVATKTPAKATPATTTPKSPSSSTSRL